ncbi:hypothetical protein E8E13_001815 [Curvularia kusanoi]|uniref:Uncharacterized protein n=1 Tax=Curvularia kusanoi TaxID=90978 RepID=A0A9P4WCH6_CURKU|nr:hypothetical protein E8E13_001815 [Curvularia kusanoi]
MELLRDVIDILPRDERAIWLSQEMRVSFVQCRKSSKLRSKGPIASSQCSLPEIQVNIEIFTGKEEVISMFSEHFLVLPEYFMVFWLQVSIDVSQDARSLYGSTLDGKYDEVNPLLL